MAAITGAPTLREETTIDFSSANFMGLLSAALMFIAFIFMPWYGIQIVDNAAKLLADYLSGVPGAQVSLWLAVIPVASFVGVGLALWGVLQPERGRQTSLLMLGTGSAVLVYYVLRLFVLPSELSMFEHGGLGFWVILIAALGMVAQYPLVVRRSRSTAAPRLQIRLPHVPRKFVPYMFLLPPLVLYVVWIIGPTISTFYLSLTSWDGITNPTYVGFANFERLFSGDRTFAEALVNNVRWLAIFISVPTTLGLGMALIFNTDMRGGRFYKVSFYSPLVLSFAVIALVWAWMYNPRLGLLNSLLTGLGVTGDSRLAGRPRAGDLVRDRGGGVAAGRLRDGAVPGRAEKYRSYPGRSGHRRWRGPLEPVPPGGAALAIPDHGRGRGDLDHRLTARLRPGGDHDARRAEHPGARQFHVYRGLQ